VARYGGEEFAVILPTLALPEALEVAEEVREAVKDLGVVHPGSAVAKVVTISIGVGVAQPDGLQGASDLVSQADKALYLAKSQGRDRVVG
jgi:diguanylate cyclase (GGDEF)-like protein